MPDDPRFGETETQTMARLAPALYAIVALVAALEQGTALIWDAVALVQAVEGDDE